MTARYKTSANGEKIKNIPINTQAILTDLNSNINIPFKLEWEQKNKEIDLVAKTISGKIIAGNCKYITSKLKKNELNKLKDDSTSIDLNPDILVLFSKNGFSNELKSQKSETLRLFTTKSFKLLLA